MLLSLAGFANADQPVHCIKDNVIGDWTFEVTRNAILPDIFQSHTICTHELPNKLQLIEAGHTFNFADEMYELRITLSENNLCSASSSVATYQTCNWSLMYD
jgi:hypothetical protein